MSPYKLVYILGPKQYRVSPVVSMSLCTMYLQVLRANVVFQRYDYFKLAEILSYLDL